MKRLKVLLAVVMAMLMWTNCFVVQAAESDMVVTAGETEVRELSQAEMELLVEEFGLEMLGSDESSVMTTTASYTAYEYSRIFDFTLNGTRVAQADAVCIVWHYTDGKVHLYNRTISLSRLATYDVSKEYGRIVNTDGSLSYTTGDRVHIYGLTSTWDYALDFRVTPDDAEFTCYEI